MGNETGEQQEPIRERVETAQPDLTEDERTVLEIAFRGELLIAIGRWEKSIKSLVARGFMLSHDKANNVITEAGRAAFEAAEDKALGAHIAKSREIAKAHSAVQIRVEGAAADLAKAAKMSAKITGHSWREECERWGQALIKRALELL